MITSVDNQQKDIADYRQEFITPLNFKGSHIYKSCRKGAKWVHEKRYNNVTDGMIVNHAVNYKYWMGLKSGHYINFGVIDQDGIGINKLNELTSDLNFKDYQIKDYSSESYLIDGSSHRYFRPRYNGKPVTYYQYSNILGNKIRSKGLELFPHTGLGLRLPFGKDQNLIDNESGAVLNLSLSQNIELMRSIEDYPLETIDPEPKLDLKYHKSLSAGIRTARVQEILEQGIINYGTRHNLLKELVIGKYRENNNPEITKRQVRQWIKSKHNGMSHTVNKALKTGKWTEINYDINHLTEWVYNTFNRESYYPDITNNLEGGITKTDTQFIADIFPRSLPDQRKLFNLICYLRTRARIKHNQAGIKIHSRQWMNITKQGNYQSFQRKLMDKRVNGRPVLIKGSGYTVQSKYSIGESKRYTINGLEPSGDFLKQDNRHITTWTDLIKSESIDSLKYKYRIDLSNRWNLDYMRRMDINILESFNQAFI